MSVWQTLALIFIVELDRKKHLFLFIPECFHGDISQALGLGAVCVCVCVFVCVCVCVCLCVCVCVFTAFLSLKEIIQ